MKPLLLITSLLTLLMLSTVNTANTAISRELQTFEANYIVTMSHIPVSSTAERKLIKQPDGIWQLTFNAEMLFYNLSEESHFRLDNGHRIQPISYRMSKTTLRKNKQVSVDFDWQRKRAGSHKNKSSWQFPIQTGDLDQISYQLQLQEDMRQGRKDLHYQIVNEDKRDDYQFLMEKEEIIETPIGAINTVRLKVQRDQKRQTWLWLAKDWNYMLVKLQHSEKNKEYVITLKDAIIGGKELKLPQTVQNNTRIKP